MYEQEREYKDGKSEKVKKLFTGIAFVSFKKE